MMINGVLLIHLYMIFCIPNKVNTTTTTWVRDLTTFLENEIEQYQVMLLYERSEMKEYTKLKDTIMQIFGKIPALKISFEEATSTKAEEWKLASLNNPQSTMIIVMQLSNNDQNLSLLEHPINFLKKIAKSKSRSKCLIILPKEEETLTFLKLLQFMWTKQFLDVTILEIFQAVSPMNTTINNCSKLPKEVVNIHQFNPFTNIYNKIIYSKRIAWFPKKTLNLHGYEMKVGLFDYPPFVFVERNATGFITKKFGPDLYLTKELSNKMNFKIDWVSPNNETNWGDLNCIKDKNTGHMYRVMNNELQFIGAIQSLRFGLCHEKFFEWSTGSRIIKTVIAVPAAPIKPAQVLIIWKNMNGFVYFTVFLATWIISRKLSFERRNWRLMEILKILLGMSTVREPEKLAERILFGSMLLSCTLYSSFIYTSFSEDNLKKEPELEMKTIKDVLVSNLKPEVSHPLFMGLSQESEGPLLQLLKKSTQVKRLSHFCLKRLIKNKNVACITLSETVKWIIAKESKKCGRSSVKVVEELVKSTVTGFIMEPGSPYVERFDEVILRLIESGIFSKLEQAYLHKYPFDAKVVDETCQSKKYESLVLRKEIIVVLLFGNIFALIIFFCEIVWFIFREKKCVFLKNSMPRISGKMLGWHPMDPECVAS